MHFETYRDFDEFAHSIRGVVSNMMMHNPMHHRWSLRIVDLQEVDVQLGQLGSGNIAQGELSQARAMLYLPLTPGTEYSANGVRLPSDAFAVLEPGSEFCISTAAAHDWCALSLPTQRFPGVADSAVAGEKSTVHVTQVNPVAANRFREIVRHMIGLASESDAFESSLAALDAASELKQLASDVLQDERADEQLAGRPKVARDQIVDLAVERLRQGEDEPVLVRDLADAAHVSERTLRNAFHEYFGMSPARYLQNRQLTVVRRALCKSDPDQTTVSELLVNHGVWEFGRFASRYRRLFGERPSETLRRKVGK